MGGELTSHPITSDRKYSDEQSNLCLRIFSSLQDLFCRHTYRKKKMDICDNALFTYENALPATCWKAIVYTCIAIAYGLTSSTPGCHRGY